MDENNSYGTTNIFGYCKPDYDTLSDDMKSHWGELEKHLLSIMGGDKAQDLYTARFVLLGSFGIALVIVLIYIWMMDKFAFWLAWISVALIQVSLVLMGWGAWATRSDVMSDGDDSNDGYGTYLFWGAILCWILALVWYVFMACNF